MKPTEIILNPGLHPVYDLTVDRFHNYLTSSGVILHNCELREIYQPREIDSIQVHFDYSQMEVRVLGAIAKEMTLVEAFRQGKDVHRYVASKIWRLPEHEVTDAQRRYAKMSTFCLHPDTKVLMLNGSKIKISELGSLVGQYTYASTSEGKIVPDKIVKVLPTIKTKKALRITYDSGFSTIVTHNHEYRLRDGSYLPASDLKVGMSLMPLYTRYSDDSDELYGYEMIFDQDIQKWEYTHRRVTDEVNLNKEDGHTVRHHVDFDKLNNDPSNIQWMEWTAHRTLHNQNYWRTSFSDWTEEKRQAQRDRMLKEVENWNDSRQFKGLLNRHLAYIKRLMSENKFLEDFYNLYRPNHLYTRFENLEYVFSVPLIELQSLASTLDYQYEEELVKTDISQLSDDLRDTVTYLWNSEDKEAVEWRLRHSERMSAMMTSLNYTDEFQHNARYSKAISGLYKLLGHSSKELVLEDYDKAWELAKANGQKYIPTKDNLIKLFGSIDQAIKTSVTEYESYYESAPNNHSVAAIEELEFDEEVQFWDLQTEKYHNFAIEASESDRSGVFVHNSILYGKTIEGFASEFMGGDVAGARKLFRDFYTEFPNIEKWIKERHKQVESNGFVTTLFGNPIHIDISNLNQAFRHAQNYPIQSSASSLAAQAIWDLFITCKARNIGALPIGFTHDASDQDVLIKDLFPFIDTMYECAVTKVDKRWGIPAAIDWELGVDQNRTIELAETKRESPTIREFTFSGTQYAFDAVIERLRHKYKVDFETTTTKSKYNTMMELFITRRAFSKYLGETVTSVSGNLRLELIED